MVTPSPEVLDENIGTVLENLLLAEQAASEVCSALSTEVHTQLDFLAPNELLGLLDYTKCDADVSIPTLLAVQRNISKRKKANASQNGSTEELGQLQEAGMSTLTRSQQFMNTHKVEVVNIGLRKHPPLFRGAVNSIVRRNFERAKRWKLEAQIANIADELSPEEILAIASEDFSPQLNPQRTIDLFFGSVALNYTTSLEQQDAKAIQLYQETLVALGGTDIVELYEGWKPNEPKASS